MILSILAGHDTVKMVLEAYQINLADILEYEVNPELGNSGLGPAIWIPWRTVDYPAIDYGLEYQYGLFRQTFPEGQQWESPDDWHHETYS